MEKLSINIKINNELHRQLPADIREKEVKYQIMQRMTKKIIDDNLVSIKETKELGNICYEASVHIMQEEEYRRLINEIVKLKRTINYNINSNWTFTLKKHLEQIKEILKIN